jgi:hypothetical protein
MSQKVLEVRQIPLHPTEEETLDYKPSDTIGYRVTRTINNTHFNIGSMVDKKTVNQYCLKPGWKVIIT